MSTKQLIFNILKENVPELSISYGFSSDEKFPKIIFFHVNTYEKRLSNKKSIKKVIYQLNFYDKKAHDIEESEMLSLIQKSLEESRLNTGSWQEVINVDEDTKTNEFLYFMEIYS